MHSGASQDAFTAIVIGVMFRLLLVDHIVHVSLTVFISATEAELISYLCVGYYMNVDGE